MNKVDIVPPMNPSTVFLGDKSISLVFPNEIPNMYAIISLVMTSRDGKMNQIIPSYAFIFITEL